MNEYRIKYVQDDSANSSYHYYMADSAKQALSWQMDVVKKKDLNINIISIEQKCPYRDKWVEEEMPLIIED